MKKRKHGAGTVRKSKHIASPGKKTLGKLDASIQAAPGIAQAMNTAAEKDIQDRISLIFSMIVLSSVGIPKATDQKTKRKSDAVQIPVHNATCPSFLSI